MHIKKQSSNLAVAALLFGRGVRLECRNCQAFRRFVDNLVGMWLRFSNPKRLDKNFMSNRYSLMKMMLFSVCFYYLKCR
jgi:hypothetical protein